MVSTDKIEKLFRTASGSTAALKDACIEVVKGEFFVLLGPSGSGKTTLLRCIAGLERPDRGEIRIGSELVFSSSRGICVRPEDRGIGMVFQSYAIWPHMTVFENVALPLLRGRRKIPRTMVAERVHRALGMVGLQGLEDRPAPLLSGGQQQRVALGRALAVEPSVLLMDEPLSNLDARLRQEVRREIRALAKNLNITVIYVTHDQEEAMELADRAAILYEGCILQIDAPERLYMWPVSPEVSQSLGSVNWLSGTVEANEVIRTPLGSIHVKNGYASAFPMNTPVRLAIRQESVELIKNGKADSIINEGNIFLGEIVSERFIGDKRSYTVRVGDVTLLARSLPYPKLEGSVCVCIRDDSVRVFKSFE
jgi:iron(III) transport system ATP-binding protein